MAIEVRSGTLAFRVYWKNPYTKKIERKSFATREEAEKEDAYIKYRLKYEPESFVPKLPRKRRATAPALAQAPKPKHARSAKEVKDTVEEIYHAYLKEKNFDRKALSWHLGSMKVPLEELGQKRICSLTRQDLAGVLHILMTSKARTANGRETEEYIKPVTVKDRMHVFFTVLNWAKRRGYVDTLPPFPEMPAGRYEKFVPPTPSEVKALYEAASPHIQRVILIGSKLGVRVGPSELFKMKWSDVDLERELVRVQAAKKNPREPWREVPIKSTLMPYFRKWKEDDEASGDEYVIHYHGRQVTQINVAWKETLEKAGIARRIRPYDLRHAFATDAIAAGADIGTVARLMGHSSTSMVLEHYQHVMTKQKKAAVEALPDF